MNTVDDPSGARPHRRVASLAHCLIASCILLLPLGACSELDGFLRDASDDSIVDTAGDAAQDPGRADEGRDPGRDDLGVDAADDPVLRDVAGDGPPDADVLADAATDPARDTAFDPDESALPDLVDVSDGGLDTDATTPRGRGTWDDPISIRSLPFRDTRDTRDGVSVEDSYACAPATDESGPEFVYRIDAPASGLVSVRLENVEAGADPDVHLLVGPNPATGCLKRAHNGFTIRVAPADGAAGSLYVVVDTWVNGDGVELPGRYTVVVDRVPLPGGSCAMREEAIAMINRVSPLQLPAFGAVVMEAHLVTVEDDFGGGWPTSSRDGIAAHYALSEDETGFDTDRGEPWAPEGEGGSEWGQGATGAYLPVLDEAWYVNMYWRNRPDRGTRMLVFNPANGRAVVASAGWETGPGDASRIGGVVEEVHDYLGSRHLSELVLGFTVDQELDLGPIDCD